ncbi:hypothetical protein ACFSCZ_15910 [Siminovitchia sediminis]|uniref:DUF5668 domain-containing protein n=1 Tax=Siminovitchia sediminis TaxID=1274353 RepID=A0ABW4KLX6_9BACI
MRTWRVGSFSMGAALLLLGVVLLLSQIFKWGDTNVALLSWWPIIFIILGAEIIVYLTVFKKEKKTIEYDFISIIFITVIGTCGLVMTMLSTSGLLDLAGQAVKAEVRTMDLPSYEERSLNGISRIVVESGSFPLTIESTEAKTVSLFGTYQEETVGDQPLIENVSDYILSEKKGDTLFVKLKELPHQRFLNHYNDADATLLIPANKQLEIKGSESHLTFKPRELKSNWSIDTPGMVTIETDDQTDTEIEARHVYELEGAWKDVKNLTEQGLKSGHISFGKGTSTMTVNHAHIVEVD